MNRKISPIVKAVRLRYTIPFVLLLVAIYYTGINPWMKSWGSTTAERQMALPGDELIPDSSGKSTQALTINASPDVIWQWLVQIGQDRAGFYSYTWLENLVGSDIHNANEIHPEWQHLEVGDGWRLVPPDYLGGLGKDSVVLLTLLLAPEAFTALGLAFALMLLAALVVTVAGRSRSVSEAVSGLATPTR